MFAGRAVGGGRKRGVASSATSTPGDEDAVSHCGEVPEGNQVAVFSFFVHDRAWRNLERQVVAVGAGAIGALPVHAALAVELRMEAVGNERVLVECGDEVDRPAMAAITAAWPAAGYKLLSAEGHAAIAAIACLNANLDFVYEHYALSALGAALGTMLMKRPRWP